jgi:membrane protease YdiL (CAAX protease family)
MNDDFEVVEPDDLPPEVIPVEPPLVRPARPGPNIWMALLWWLLLLLGQTGIVVVAGVIIGVVAVVARGGKPVPPDEVLELPGAALGLIVAATGGVMLIAAAVVGVMFRARAPRLIALRRLAVPHAALVILLVPPFLLVGSEVQLLASRVLPHFNLNDPFYAKIAEQHFAVILLVACIFPGIGEELFFRAFLGRGLVARHGVVWGTIFTAALFGALHFEPAQVVGTAVLGAAFQLVFLTTKSFWGPALFHGLNNAAAFGLMRLATDPRWRAILGEEESVPPALLAASLAATLALCWLMYATRTRWILPDGRAWSPGYVTAETPPAHLGAVPKMTAPHPLVVIVAVAACLAFAAALGWELKAIL